MRSRLTFTCLPILSLPLTMLGCNSNAPDGLQVYCDGEPHGLHYYKRHPLCPEDDPNCYSKVENFPLRCLGDEHFDETGETGGIDLDRWPNDTDSLDYIRNLCVAECNSLQANGNAPDGFEGNCTPDPETSEEWEILNYQDYPTPDPLGISRIQIFSAASYLRPTSTSMTLKIQL